MMRRFLPVLALLAALPAPAPAAEGTPLTAEAFDALTRGKTMDTATAAGVYGVETFLPGQRVIWRDAERCTRGTWHQVDAEICFLYEDRPEKTVCWTYYDRGDRIEGWYAGDEPVAEPIVLTPGQGPVSCDGYLGV